MKGREYLEQGMDQRVWKEGTRTGNGMEKEMFHVFFYMQNLGFEKRIEHTTRLLVGGRKEGRKTNGKVWEE